MLRARRSGTPLTATNAAGSFSQTGSEAIDTARLRKLAIRPQALVAAARGPSAAPSKRRKGGRGGAKVSFRLNEGAVVSFIVKQRRRARGSRRARFVRLPGGFRRKATAGRNSFRFSGRLRGRKLKQGRYRLLATPRGVGEAGRTRSIGFRVK